MSFFYKTLLVILAVAGISHLVSTQRFQRRRPPQNLDCESGDTAFRYGHFWYQVFECPKSFRDAQLHCQQHMVKPSGRLFPQDKDGYLLWISNPDERDWIAHLLHNRYGYNVNHGIWLGMTRGRHHGGNPRCGRDWGWLSRERMRYCFWEKGQPNNFYRPDENCAIITNNYNWNDVECLLPMKFICKRRIRGNRFDPGFGTDRE